jgi:radical SAM protein (TIGR01212 family)
MADRYNGFGSYVKKRFGEVVYKVNVDAGFTCPNRDGSVGFGGCIYCNNDSFRPSSCRAVTPVRLQIENGIAYLTKRYGARKFIAYFQPYTNTYANIETLRSLYYEALENPLVVGLAIGTRPDCVDEQKIELLSEISRRHFVLVEYGLQSIYDKTLRYINRGHDYGTFLNALRLTQGSGIEIGSHIIVGFPTETREEMFRTAAELSGLPVGYLKIHQLQIVRETILASRFEQEPFPVFGYEEYLEFVVDFIERLRPEIVLQRLFATAPDDILIAPKWGKTRQQILRGIEERFARRDAFQGRLFKERVTVPV